MFLENTHNFCDTIQKGFDLLFGLFGCPPDSKNTTCTKIFESVKAHIGSPSFFESLSVESVFDAESSEESIALVVNFTVVSNPNGELTSWELTCSFFGLELLTGKSYIFKFDFSVVEHHANCFGFAVDVEVD